MVERLHLPDAWIAIEHFWPATVERWLLTSPFYKFGMYSCGFLVHPL
jgi:hypothetical protein